MKHLPKLIICSLIICFSSCKKEGSSIELGDSTLVVINETDTSNKYLSGIALKALVKFDAPSGTNRVQAWLIENATATEYNILDTALNVDSTYSEFRFMDTLGCYSTTDFTVKFIAIDGANDSATGSFDFDYINRVKFTNRADLEKVPWGYPVRGYDLLKDKLVSGSGADVSIFYNKNSSGDRYPIVTPGTGNKTQFARVSFPVNDSMVTVDMVEEKMKTASFSDQLTISNMSMHILAKHPTNNQGKKWSLMKVWYYTTFWEKDNSWWKGQVRTRVYQFPEN